MSEAIIAKKAELVDVVAEKMKAAASIVVVDSRGLTVGQDATAALTGVYATDTSYYAKLNNIIETYNLTQYDSPNVQGGITGSVYNPYRQQFTSQEILNLDIAWANRLNY